MLRKYYESDVFVPCGQIYRIPNGLGGRQVLLFCYPNSNLNSINEGTTAGFVLRSAVHSSEALMGTAALWRTLNKISIASSTPADLQSNRQLDRFFVKRHGILN